jgi:hypothetical protein
VIHHDIEFRDKDPEDAWDDGDDTDFKLLVLERVVESIRTEKRNGGQERAEARRAEALRLLRKLEQKIVDEERDRSHDGARLRDIREALEKL